jgi:predicted nucleic acid-binding protein
MRQRLGTGGLAVSVVTVAELKRGALAARWGDRRTVELDEHLRGYVVLAVDAEIAEEWARVRVRCDELGRQKGDNDLWVAATAKRYGLPLATLDRDHHDVPGLTVIRDDGSEVSIPE